MHENKKRFIVVAGSNFCQTILVILLLVELMNLTFLFTSFGSAWGIVLSFSTRNLQAIAEASGFYQLVALFIAHTVALLGFLKRMEWACDVLFYTYIACAVMCLLPGGP